MPDQTANMRRACTGPDAISYAVFGALSTGAPAEWAIVCPGGQPGPDRLRTSSLKRSHSVAVQISVWA
jgi:hypothetical protein